MLHVFAEDTVQAQRARLRCARAQIAAPPPMARTRPALTRGHVRRAARAPRSISGDHAFAIAERYMPHGMERSAFVIGRSRSGITPKLSASAAIQ